jgi:hypothetical protein
MAVLLTEFLTSELCNQNSFYINNSCIIPTTQFCWYTAIIIVISVVQPGAKVSQVYWAFRNTDMKCHFAVISAEQTLLSYNCVKTVVLLSYLRIMFMWFVSLFL